VNSNVIESLWEVNSAFKHIKWSVQVKRIAMALKNKKCGDILYIITPWLIIGNIC